MDDLLQMPIDRAAVVVLDTETTPEPSDIAVEVTPNYGLMDGGERVELTGGRNPEP